MSCSFLLKIITFCGIFYSNKQTNDITAATFNFKNSGTQITSLNDEKYGKCFPEFNQNYSSSFYKKDKNYLIIDETFNIDSK